jgi:riboflavin kinase/FMN adenylyltransferase
VLKGKGLAGDVLGFKTANICPISGLVLPKFGVYSCHVLIEKGNKRHKGIVNIGKKPTFGEEEILIEVHILNFNEQIYGKKITIILDKFIREERKFASINQLKMQIAEDIKKI